MAVGEDVLVAADLAQALDEPVRVQGLHATHHITQGESARVGPAALSPIPCYR